MLFTEINLQRQVSLLKDQAIKSAEKSYLSVENILKMENLRLQLFISRITYFPNEEPK